MRTESLPPTKQDYLDVARDWGWRGTDEELEAAKAYTNEFIDASDLWDVMGLDLEQAVLRYNTVLDHPRGTVDYIPFIFHTAIKQFGLDTWLQALGIGKGRGTAQPQTYAAFPADKEK